MLHYWWVDNVYTKHQTEEKAHRKVVNWIRTDNTIVKRKKTNDYLQKTTQKTQDRAIWTPLKTVGDILRVLHILSSD